MFCRRHTGGFRDRILFDRTGHLEHVFGRFFPDHVHDVVNRDNADQFVVVVDDRNREQVVTRHLTGDFFLVHVDRHADHVAHGDVFQRRRGRNRQQLPQREHPDQALILVSHVNIKHHFRFRRQLEASDGILRRRIFREREEFRRHDAAGRTLRILQQVGDFRGVFRPHQRENLFGSFFRQNPEEVGHVVRAEVFDQPSDIRVQQVRQHLIDTVAVELAQHLAALRLASH